jgi:hypothetical protein
MKQVEITDANGNQYRIVRCQRGGWAIRAWSRYYQAWVGDPPAKGPFRTRREALAKAFELARWSELVSELAREYEREPRGGGR